MLVNLRSPDFDADLVSFIFHNLMIEVESFCGQRKKFYPSTFQTLKSQTMSFMLIE